MRHDDETLALQKTFTYPGDTLHVAPWVMIVTGLMLLSLSYFLNGLDPKQQMLFLAFGVFWFLVGGYIEWSLRDRIGVIEVNGRGIKCVLPWRRHRLFQWSEIHEVRCTARQFKRQYSFWEIVGKNPKDRMTFSWELKGYKQLLWLIRQHAPHLQRFDPEPDDLEPIVT